MDLGVSLLMFLSVFGWSKPTIPGTLGDLNQLYQELWLSNFKFDFENFAISYEVNAGWLRNKVLELFKLPPMPDLQSTVYGH